MSASETHQSPAALAGIIDAMTGKKVLVIGDIMLDRYVFGTVGRLSPESQAPVLNLESETAVLGGAGNVLANLQSLGLNPYILALSGTGRNADMLAALVKDTGIDTAGLIREKGRLTTVKTRYLNGHQHLLRTDSETTRAALQESEQTLIDRAGALMPECGAIILSDYNKGVLSPVLLESVIRGATELSIPVLVDPKKTDYRIYKGAYIITPNQKELSEAAGGVPVGSDEDITAAARKIIDEAGIDTVIATRAQDGISVISGKKEPRVSHMRAAAAEVCDVSGAGDTVIAAIAASIAAGASVIEAAIIANTAAGIVVAKTGTACASATELKQAVLNPGRSSDQPAQKPSGKTALTNTAIDHSSRTGFIYDNGGQALEQIERWRATGLRIGFTNGCFDILHQGHAAYLNAARDRCDKLIIGLNCDESVRRLKGAERPVNNEHARATLLSALAAVDMVVIFGQAQEEDDKPVQIIETIKPDIFFKGGDYTIDQLPEAATVKSYGGTVEIMPLTEGESTSATITRLKSGTA